MVNIELVTWKGNKDVPILKTSLPSVPRLEDYLEFQSGGHPIRGKVTRVTYKNEIARSSISAPGESVWAIQVRINTRA